MSGDTKNASKRTPVGLKREARIALLSALRSLDGDGSLRETDALGYALIAATKLRHIAGSQERLCEALEALEAS